MRRHLREDDETNGNRDRKRHKPIPEYDEDEIKPLYRPIPEYEQNAQDVDIANGQLPDDLEELDEKGEAYEEAEVEDASDTGDEVDDDDGNVLDAEALKKSREKLKEMADKGFSLSGILESVQLDRFMSHDCFEYKLGRNVNIVNGPNGSGKSAIVAALQIGLGARASATERGSKIEDHIMHKKDSAIITIRIHNGMPQKEDKDNPDLSFKFERYREKIIIERKLVRKGGSTWAVKDWRGRHVALNAGETPRSEVRDIVDHFGFMVDNPVAILTQTKSKAFLAKCRPVEHFKLYKAATLLGPLERELQATMTVAQGLKNDIAKKKKEMPRAEKKLHALESAHNEAQELKHIDQRIAETETLFAWTVHAEKELELNTMEGITAEKFEPQVQKAQQRHEEISTEVQKLNEEISNVNKEIEEAKAKYDEVYAAARESKKVETSHQLEIKRRRALVKDQDHDIEEGKQNVNRATEKLNSTRLEHLAGQEQKDQMANSLQDASNRVTELEKELDEWRHREGEAQERRYQVEENVSKSRDELQRVRGEFERKRQEQMMNENAAHQDNDLYRFGHGFADLARLIHQNRHRFDEPPIGPLGQFIKVKDQSWAPAVEACLGSNTLRSYIVHSGRDSALLQRLLPNRGVRPTIIVADLRRARYAIRESDMPHVRHLGHCTMMDMLTLEHNAVFNVLVDQLFIERLVLVGNGEDITELGWSRISNLVAAWNKSGEHAYSRNGSNVFRKANENMGRSAPILSADRSAYLRALHEEVQRLQERMNEQQNTVRQCQKEQQGAGSEFNQASRTVREVQRSLHVSKEKKMRIEDQLSQATNAFDAKPFEDEIHYYEKNVQEAEKRRDAELKWVEELEQKLQDLEAKSASTYSEAMKEDKKYKKLHEVLERRTAAISRGRNELNQAKLAWQKANQHLNAAKAEMDEKRKESSLKMNMARSLGPRPDTVDPAKNPSKKVNRALTNLKERMHAEQERRGGRCAEDIEEEYLQAQRKHETTKNMLDRIEGYENALEKGITQRRKTRRVLERKLKIHVRSHFVQFLSVRGHSGSLQFKRNEKGFMELIITTQMASHKSTDGETYETKDLRSLSGGERSFTTLAFMLALAEVVQNPIRVMDEIDVFQDEANRRASFKTLINYCTNFLTDKQFIIITPLRLPDIEPSDHVRIVKLKAPRGDRGTQLPIDRFAQRN